jgi:hypothetical protein
MSSSRHRFKNVDDETYNEIKRSAIKDANTYARNKNGLPMERDAEIRARLTKEEIEESHQEKLNAEKEGKNYKNKSHGIQKRLTQDEIEESNKEKEKATRQGRLYEYKQHDANIRQLGVETEKEKAERQIYQIERGNEERRIRLENQRFLDHVRSYKTYKKSPKTGGNKRKTRRRTKRRSYRSYR